MKNFELLKRTYPVSEFDRLCDGYEYIIYNSTPEQRLKWNIIDNELQKIIKSGEKYIYQVAKEKKEFKIMSLCFKNYEIIRNFFFIFDDE